MKIRSVSFNLVDQIRRNRKNMPYFMVIDVISPYSMVISPDLKVNSPDLNLVSPGFTCCHDRFFAPFARREDPRGPGDGAGHSQASPRPCRDFLKGNCRWGSWLSLLEHGAYGIWWWFDSGLPKTFQKNEWWYKRWLASGSLLLFAIENGDL